jgi:hypothetical protein
MIREIQGEANLSVASSQIWLHLCDFEEKSWYYLKVHFQFASNGLFSACAHKGIYIKYA